MKYLIISFKSRNSLFAFVKTARSYGLTMNIVNTPRTISVSCGLSAKTDIRHYDTILKILTLYKSNDFLGLYLIQSLGLTEQVQRLY